VAHVERAQLRPFARWQEVAALQLCELFAAQPAVAEDEHDARSRAPASASSVMRAFASRIGRSYCPALSAFGVSRCSAPRARGSCPASASRTCLAGTWSCSASQRKNVFSAARSFLTVELARPPATRCAW